jgi:putative endonuclease
MLNNANKKQNKYFGKIGEDIACDFLKKNNFSIIARNYQRKWGELDIVGFKDGAIHFFEVKSTTFNIGNVTDIHRPEENVHGLKVKHIRRMVETYLNENKISDEIRFYFHVLAIHIDSYNGAGNINWIQDIIL